MVDAPFWDEGPRVWNKRDANAPKEAVYVGRPSKWGNPYTHLPQSTAASVRVLSRDDAITMYRWWITEGGGRHLLEDLHELRGNDLVCWCAPRACHAQILLELANV